MSIYYTYFLFPILWTESSPFWQRGEIKMQRHVRPMRKSIYISNRAYFRTQHLPSGKRLHQRWNITIFLMEQLTISMVIFNSYVSHKSSWQPSNAPIHPPACDLQLPYEALLAAPRALKTSLFIEPGELFIAIHTRSKGKLAKKRKSFNVKFGYGMVYVSEFPWRKITYALLIKHGLQ